MSAVHPQVADEMKFVLEKSLKMFEFEKERVVEWIESLREARLKTSVDDKFYYMEWSACLIHHGIPASAAELMNNIQNMFETFAARDWDEYVRSQFSLSMI
jgi:hypothetical protein